LTNFTDYRFSASAKIKV